MVTLGKMMQRLGLDFGPESDMFLPIGAQLADTCMRCPNIDSCRKWLSGKQSGKDYGTFCPNAEAFNFLRRRKGLDPD